MCVVCGVVAGVVCGFGFVWYSPSLCLGFGWYGCPVVWRWCSVEGLVAFDLVWDGLRCTSAGVVCGFAFVWYRPSLCLGLGWYGRPFVWRWCSVEGLVAFDLVWGWPPLYLGWCGMWFWFCLVQALLVSRLVWYDVRVVWLCFTR